MPDGSMLVMGLGQNQSLHSRPISSSMWYLIGISESFPPSKYYRALRYHLIQLSFLKGLLQAPSGRIHAVYHDVRKISVKM